MIHKCNVHCFSLDKDTSELLGKKSDEGKWMPFAVDISLIIAVKLSHDDDEKMTFGKTTIYLQDGDTFVIDTPYDVFLDKWERFVGDEDEIADSNKEEDLDL